MNVTISVFGRFHAFYMAHQLDQRDALDRLITTYPKFEVKKYGVPDSKISSLPSYEALQRLWDRWLPDSFRPDVDFEVWLSNSFDRSAAQYVPSSTDLYVGWSSKSERGLQRAREVGALGVIERNSSHIEYQRDILREEYERVGVNAPLPAPEIVEKEKREYRAADYVTVPSEFVRRTFLDKGFPESKILTVPFGVDLSSFRPVSKEDDTFRIVYAGQMSLRKGVQYLLQAFAELDLPDAELWLLGSKLPEIAPYFERYEDSFRHFGHVPQPKLHEYYSQGSAFAMCSVEDGFGMVVPQAMACGLPVICTTNVGSADLIQEGENGFVLPIRDVDALKEKIHWLYEQPEDCQEMGRNALESVRDGFSWSKYGERIVAAYSKILGESTFT